ncbi:YqjF family protein [Halomicrobium sp. HM KBTZ05]|uniref:YqjF family protein n=1 Tax=Halomicrobium sp. HM KBTZ05 TaxID=3242663 RepID=UPI00355890A8
MSGPLRPLSITLSDVCFLHWPVAPAAVRAVLPNWAEPDTMDDTAWVSVLSLSIDRFDAFGVPVRERVESVAVRTYVQTPSGDRAVAFLSLDVTDRLVADALRTLFHLPASHADVRRRRQDSRTEVVSRRRDGADARLGVTFGPTGTPTTTAPDTLAAFLLDRERYVTTGPLETRLVGSVGHPPWRVQPADAAVTETTLLDAAGVDSLDGEPLAHYSPGVEMGVGVLEPL